MSPTILAMSAHDILSVPGDQPHRLFPGDRELARKLFKQLAVKWHPDHNRSEPLATDVFQHLNSLLHTADKQLQNGTWAGRGSLSVPVKHGKDILLHYVQAQAFELGRAYFCQNSVAFLVDGGNSALFRAALETMAGFTYASERMREECSRYLPEIVKAADTEDGHLVIVKKTKDLVRLSDLATHQGGNLDPKHVAWIMSSLLNIACWLKWSKLAHNAISPDTVFVSPKYHSCVLLGGWWYTKAVGERLSHLPPFTYRVAPRSLRNDKIASPSLDIESIKAIGRDLIGKRPDIPEPLASWLKIPGSADAFKEYGHWERVRDASFGDRRFTKLEVSPSDIYPAL
ncbi:J domain-containing protein [Thalassospira xiamenensis]|uniref:J domain-containing protein n=1 Tax=Thalassospira xiamenensis TaxID=220697 RepID=A0A285TSN3_9PROT|nr:J domain-containing protein [Thalassospira xiamenensis]SOC26768.1 hypothetical protein SAMN05428964_105203 [Thalassospira xiamenensis]